MRRGALDVQLADVVEGADGLEELDVVDAILLPHRLEQRLIAARSFDARELGKWLLQVVGLARAKDLVPVVDTCEARGWRVPDRHVFGLGPESPRAAQIEHRPVLRPRSLPAALSGEHRAMEP